MFIIFKIKQVIANFKFAVRVGIGRYLTHQCTVWNLSEILDVLIGPTDVDICPKCGDGWHDVRSLFNDQYSILWSIYRTNIQYTWQIKHFCTKVSLFTKKRLFNKIFIPKFNTILNFPITSFVDWWIYDDHTYILPTINCLYQEYTFLNLTLIHCMLHI